MNATQVKVREPVTLARTATVHDAAALMDARGVGSVLVVEDDGSAAGIVTDRDLTLRVLARSIPADARVDAVMTCNVVGVPVSAGRVEIMRAFAEHSVRRLAVMDGAKPVGLVALDDVLATLTDDPAVADLAATARTEIDHPRHEAGFPVPVATAPAPPRGRHWARAGDTLVVHGAAPGIHRDGEIVEVSSPAGEPPFTVRWSDGRTSYVYPGADAEIRHHAPAPASVH